MAIKNNLLTHVKNADAVYLVGQVVLDLDESLRLRPRQIVVGDVSVFVDSDARFARCRFSHIRTTAKMCLEQIFKEKKLHSKLQKITL